MKAAVVRELKQPLIIEDRPVPERRQLEDVNSAIHEVESGQVKARLVFDLQ
jgi:Zn-dependent alcohol dehydrogenase